VESLAPLWRTGGKPIEIGVMESTDLQTVSSLPNYQANSDFIPPFDWAA
jgi:hypothetical protein